MYQSAFIGQAVALLLIAVFTAFFLWHAYQKRRAPALARIIPIVISTLLHLISAIYAMVRPITIETRALDILPLYLSLVVAYGVIDQLLNGTDYIPLWRTRAFYTALVCGAGVLLLDWFQRDNLASFPDGDPYQPTLLFFLSTAANWAMITWLLARGSWLCWKSLPAMESAAPRMRCLILMAAFGLAALGLGVATELNILVTVLIGRHPTDGINMIYQLSRISAFLLLMIGLVAPRSLLLRARRILDIRTRRRLRYLQERLRCIAHSRYRKEGRDIISAVVEISDLTRMIWTHKQQSAPIQPDAEAAYIFELLAEQRQFKETGPFRPPRLASADPIRHYVHVAAYLKQLEAVRRKS